MINSKAIFYLVLCVLLLVLAFFSAESMESKLFASLAVITGAFAYHHVTASSSMKNEQP